MQDSLLTTLYTLGKEWNVSHEFKPTEYLDNWRNSLHLTIGGSNGEHGDRTPSIWPSTPTAGKMLIASSVNEDKNFVHKPVQPLVREWTPIQISQTLEDGRYMYRIVIGGKEVHAVENTEPKEFCNVKVYASDPWGPAQPGAIRNLLIESAGQGEMNNTIKSLKCMFIKIYHNNNHFY